MGLDSSPAPVAARHPAWPTARWAAAAHPWRARQQHRGAATASGSRAAAPIEAKAPAPAPTSSGTSSGALGLGEEVTTICDGI